ncbi:MAG: hypothetical protein L3J74_11905 [Bacteroidales bacterium]|nr:hypothetical protein [Bacteroidales bacterium]
MKTVYYILVISAFAVISCNKPVNDMPEEKQASEISFEIVDQFNNNLLPDPDTAVIDSIEFFYLKGNNKEPLNLRIHRNDSVGTLVAVQDIPELSSEEHIKFYYLKFKNYPVDTLYLDIWKVHYEYPHDDNYYYNYLEMRCNGKEMKYDEHFMYYIIQIN